MIGTGGEDQGIPRRTYQLHTTLAPLPEASAEDRTGFEVERDVEKDGKRMGKGWEKTGIG